MPTIGSVAHHRARGERTPLASMDDPIEERAYALWRAVRSGVVRTRGVQAHGPANLGLSDMLGYEVRVNMTSKARDIWPELAALSKNAQETYVRELRSFLRGSENAVCIARHDPTAQGAEAQPLWWIRDEWQTAKVVPIFRTLEMTPRERRLSAAEAGEDREPAQVEVRYREESEVDPQREAEEGLAARTLAFIRQSAEPVYQTDVVYGLQANDSDVGRALRSLTGAGRLYRRYETAAERPKDAVGRMRYLYWFEVPVPPRETPLGTNKSRALDFVAQLAPGEEMRITWMPQVDKDEIREMVDAGLLEYLHNGEYVRQLGDPAPTAETTPPTEEPMAKPPRKASPPPRQPSPPPSPPTPPPAPATIPDIRPTSLGDEIAAVIERRIEGLVEERTGGMSHRLEEMSRQLSEERQARQRLEAELQEARDLADKRGKALKALTEDL